MIKTSASLLACDLADISGELSRCKAANVDWIHFDVMDGAFVDQITYGSPVLKCVRRATDMFLDVHLMVNDPASQIKFFAEAGADLISFHLESRSDARMTLELIRSFGVKSALAVKPGTHIEEAFPLVELCDMVLVMTVEPRCCRSQAAVPGPWRAPASAPGCPHGSAGRCTPGDFRRSSPRTARPPSSAYG